MDQRHQKRKQVGNGKKQVKVGDVNDSTRFPDETTTTAHPVVGRHKKEFFETRRKALYADTWRSCWRL
jgi:hypothetical protein